MVQADIICSRYNREDCLKAAIQLFYAGGNYEEVINHETGKTKSYHYIHGGSGLAAVFIAEEDSAETDNLYYIHKDYLGSILTLTNQEGTAVERYSFDAWGHRRNPTDWSQWQGDSTDYIVNRGFTGHEHMDIFGLINMNGRVYDPDLGRFISPDPYVQMPGNSQNFNRYTYALNNPLKYTDPSGDNMQPHPDYEGWGSNIITTGAGRGFMRAFNQYGYMSSDQLGTPQLAYGYDWSTGTYRNNEGSVVSWYDVKDNMFNSNSSHDTYALFQTAFRNENNQWVGTGNFGVIKEGLYKSTGLYPTFTVYSNALDFASGMESGFGSEGDPPYPFIGAGFAAGDELMFSKNFNTWMGKDIKIRSQNWGGNGRTGGKFKFAKSTGKIFGIIGKGISAYSMYNSYNKWTSGKISSQLFIGDMASGLFGIFGGIYGASWEIGWQLGKNYGPSTWFEQEPREPLIFESEGLKEYIENNP